MGMMVGCQGFSQAALIQLAKAPLGPGAQVEQMQTETSGVHCCGYPHVPRQTLAVSMEDSGQVLLSPNKPHTSPTWRCPASHVAQPPARSQRRWPGVTVTAAQPSKAPKCSQISEKANTPGLRFISHGLRQKAALHRAGLSLALPDTQHPSPLPPFLLGFPEIRPSQSTHLLL